MVDQIFDFEASLERFGGDRELYLDLVRFFLEDAPKLLAEIHAGLRHRNAQAVERGAHNLKSLAANFDASWAVKAASEVEELASSASLARTIHAAQNLAAEIARLQEALRTLQPGTARE